MNSRVVPDTICGPPSETAKSTGSCSSVLGATIRASMPARRPSASNAYR